MTQQHPLRFGDFAATERWLFSRRPLHRRTSLEPLEGFMHALGDPLKDLTLVHIAGTNGKGSVCSKVALALALGGWRTGLFTSPHLHDFCERIRIDDINITPDEVKNYLHRLSDAIPTLETLHFFDIAFLMALLHFRENSVDIAILETGLGGRLDATNLCRPLVSAITTIGEDHRQLLGNSLHAIAREKGGIAKAHTPLILGARAQNLGIEEMAAERGAPLIALRDLPQDTDAYNSALAEAVLDVIADRFPLLPTARTRGLAFRPLGRWELVARPRRAGRWPRAVLFDVAHNAQGFEQLMRSIRASYPSASLHVIFGLGSDKDLTPCLAALGLNTKDRLYPADLTGAGAKGHTANTIAQTAERIGLCIHAPCGAPQTALDAALATAQDDDLLVACGSFHLIGALRNSLGLSKNPASFTPKVHST